MLEGITILNQFNVNIFNEAAFWVGLLSTFFIGAVAFIVISIIEEEETWMLGTIIAVLIGIVIGASAGAFWFDTTETHYQVTISEEVSMTEFNERYEIIEQNGQIFTIREKEMDENV